MMASECLRMVVGLDIRVETPQEISVSIVAESIAFRKYDSAQ